VSALDLHLVQRLHGGVVYDGGRRWVGPGPGHSRRDQSLSVRVDGEKVLVHSFANDPFPDCAAYLGLTRDVELADPATRARMRGERDAELRAARDRNWQFCEEVWAASVEPEGTLAEVYLTGRGLPWPYPAALRFNPACPLDYRRSRVAPALVALVCSPDGKAQGLHVTALAADGSGKAPGLNARVMFGSCRGNAVHLAAPYQGELGLAEGIETALSFGRLHKVPTWCALSSAGLHRFEPPAGTSLLNVAVDGDKAGREAGESLARRVSKYCDVVMVDPGDGLDWNDVLRGASNG
jgi:hypothetical protein